MIDLAAWWPEAHRVAKPRAAIVCTGSQPFTSRLIMSNIERFRYEWIWDKRFAGNRALVKHQPLKTHENILVFSSLPHRYMPIMAKRDRPIRVGSNECKSISSPIKIAKREFSTKIYDEKFPESIVTYSSRNENRFHPTQKPVALFEYLIRTYTQPGDLVVDPFVGSGTTAIAARNTGRRFICGDLDAGYVETARARLAEPYTLPMFDAIDAPARPGVVQRGLFEEE